MLSSNRLARLGEHLRARKKLWLFLDYDGTLVPIAPTPDQARPDQALLTVLNDLARVEEWQTVILSGRPLQSLERMLPIEGIILAGVYGSEVRLARDEIFHRVNVQDIRPSLVSLKAHWEQLISGRAGFFIEDKELSLALHARFASVADAETVLPRARDQAARYVDETWRLLGGDRFLELAPVVAHKGRTVDWLLNQYGSPDARITYFGDDDKDAEAFEVVRRRGGLTIGVGSSRYVREATVHLDSPLQVRIGLKQLWEELQAEP